MSGQGSPKSELSMWSALASLKKKIDSLSFILEASYSILSQLQLQSDSDILNRDIPKQQTPETVGETIAQIESQLNAISGALEINLAKINRIIGERNVY